LVAVVVATPVQVGSGHWCRVYFQFPDRFEKYSVIRIVIVKTVMRGIGDYGIVGLRIL